MSIMTITEQDSDKLDRLYRAAKQAVATQNALAQVLAAHHAELASTMRAGGKIASGTGQIVVDLQERLEEATTQAIQATSAYGAFATQLGLIPLPL